ncbi:Neutral ceramidase [Capsicum chinense]|nr:Neutral ceramidase [Capsicum chinense]
MFNLIPEDWRGSVTPWVAEITKLFRRLKALHFRRMIVRDSDLELPAIRRGKVLQVLKLDKCSGFSNDGLLHIAHSCRISHGNKVVYDRDRDVVYDRDLTRLIPSLNQLYSLVSLLLFQQKMVKDFVKILNQENSEEVPAGLKLPEPFSQLVAETKNNKSGIGLSYLLTPLWYRVRTGRPVTRLMSVARRVKRALRLADKPKFVSAFCQSNCGDVSPNVLVAFCIDTGLSCDFNHSTCGGKNELCYGRGPGYTDEFESTIDGPGEFDFKQGDDRGNTFWKLVQNLLKKPGDEQKRCQHPKPILLDTGVMKVLYDWAVPIGRMHVSL